MQHIGTFFNRKSAGSFLEYALPNKHDISSYYKTLTAQDVSTAFNERETFAADVLMGLSGTMKSLPSKYFYDDEGSKIFQEITALPEYYLTRCEAEIFLNYREDIAKRLPAKPFNLVELGAGDGTKTNLLIEYFIRPPSYR